jgi:DeoR family glycerol-3-phosphate regulon repressor
LRSGEVRARQFIKGNSRASFLVLDHTKLGRAAHVRAEKINDPTKVFCDRKTPETIVTNLQQSGVELVLCGADGAK